MPCTRAATEIIFQLLLTACGLVMASVGRTASSMKKSCDKALRSPEQYRGTKLLLVFRASVGLWQVCGMRPCPK